MMPENRRKYRGFLLSAVLLLAAAAALAVDVPIAQTFRRLNQSPPIASWLGYINMFEMFGHGFGVCVLLVVLHQLDPGRRWAIPRVFLCAMAAGGLANLLKMIVLRTRPYECDLSGAVWNAFGPWLPIFSAGSPGQSFPSAHTATAAGFAAALIWLYPQGRLLFTTLTFLVGCQRIVCGAHYWSDVLVGAAAGVFVAQWFFNVGYLPAWCDRFESRWRHGAADTAS
jgi:membrane-associated phospholipid phosphatase